MSFKPIQKLSVFRTLNLGLKTKVGELAQNRQGVFFQYDEQYLNSHTNLSPFTLSSDTKLQLSASSPHNGLHGVFADSLPDGWGLLLQNRAFRKHNVNPQNITQLDRLAFVGNNAMGALSFSPVSGYINEHQFESDVWTMGLEAQALFDDQTQDVLSALIAAGSSGGARPKAQLFFPKNQTKQNQGKHCRTQALPGDEAWLVKFTSKQLALGHEEGICEALYLSMANQASLDPPKWQLLDAPKKSGATSWLAVKRFDWIYNQKSNLIGKYHMHTACGLLDADFRMPSLDYEDLIKASRQLCQSPAVGQLQFRRAIFNLYAANQDDHSKNWSFLQDDNGQWSPAPFYDVTYSPHPFNEHATSFNGHGKQPPLKTIQKLSVNAGFASWNQAKQEIQKIVDVIGSMSSTAKEFELKKSTIKEIEQTLNERRKANSELF